MLMSFDSTDAVGTGTQDDPYNGVIELDNRVYLNDQTYFEVGTQVRIKVSGSGETPSLSGDDIGLKLVVNPDYTTEQYLEGTIDETGILVLTVETRRISWTYTIIAVEPTVEDLEFVSNPISNGVIEYVA